MSGSLFQVFGNQPSTVPIPLQGLSTAQLQANLAQAQTAYNTLMTGARVAEVSYSQGDGSKTVRYDRSSLPNLVAYIQQLNVALGNPQNGRRATRIVFG